MPKLLLVPVSIFMMNIAVSRALAVDQATLDRLDEYAKQACLIGTQFDLHADANGNLTFRNLLKPGAEGKVDTNVRDAPGAAAIFDQQLRVAADRQIQECMKPYINRIFSAILGATPPTPPPSSQSEQHTASAITSVEKAGLKGSIIQIASSNNLQKISAVMLLVNTSNKPLELFGVSQGISGIGDNGQKYVSGPGSFEGITACNDNPQTCPHSLERGRAEMTAIQPGEEVRVVLSFYKSAQSRGDGQISDLLALNVPFYRRELLDSEPAGTQRRPPQPVTLTFGKIPLMR